MALDFLEDSRSFALADIDRDGRLEIVLKNRNAPQMRVLHNAMKNIGRCISFRLRGKRAIATRSARPSRWKPAAIGRPNICRRAQDSYRSTPRNCSLEWESMRAIRATVRWPSGLVQVFDRCRLTIALKSRRSQPFPAKAFAPLAVPGDSPARRLRILALRRSDMAH